MKARALTASEPNPAGRNLWNWIEWFPEPFPGQHHATFPTFIPKLAILAGTSERGACSACGAPWARLYERTGHVNGRERAHVPGNSATKVDSTGWRPTSVDTDQWQPTCRCDAGDPQPCLVLDPFSGSGTTGLAALRLGRRYIGLDLSPEYVALSERRIVGDAPMFNAQAGAR